LQSCCYKQIEKVNVICLNRRLIILLVLLVCGHTMQSNIQCEIFKLIINEKIYGPYYEYYISADMEGKRWIDLPDQTSTGHSAFKNLKSQYGVIEFV